MLDLLVLLAGSLALASLGARLLRRRRAGWSNGRIACVVAAPLPALAVALCLYIAIGALLTSPDRCGVDACAMAIAISAIGAGYAVVIYLVAALLTAALLRAGILK